MCWNQKACNTVALWSWTQTIAHLVVESIAFGLQIGRRQGQGCLEGRRVRHPESSAVKVGEQPLVRVEAEGIGELHTIKPVSHAGNDCGSSSIGSIHMYPAHFNTYHQQRFDGSKI